MKSKARNTVHKDSPHVLVFVDKAGATRLKAFANIRTLMGFMCRKHMHKDECGIVQGAIVKSPAASGSGSPNVEDLLESFDNTQEDSDANALNCLS